MVIVSCIIGFIASALISLGLIINFSSDNENSKAMAVIPFYIGTTILLADLAINFLYRLI